MREIVRVRPWPTRVAVGSAIFIVILGLTVLVGWLSQTAALVQLTPPLPPMTRNAAACFLLCGVALLTVLRGPRWLAVVCTGIVSLASVLTIVEWAFRVNVGIDELLGQSYIALNVSSPGRMAPVVAICFALGSIGLLLGPNIPGYRGGLLLGLSGSIIAAAGIATTMTSVLRSSDVFEWGDVTRVALHTAVGLWVFGFGVLALAWQLETDHPGIPRWLPISVTVGVATSTLGLWESLIADGHPPIAPLPVVVLVGGCLMAPTIGLTLYLAQRAQTQAAALGQSEARKAAILNSSLDCILTIDHEGCITEFNPAAERTFGYRRNDVVGKQLAEVIIPPSLREQHRRGLSRYLATGEARVLGRRVEMTAMRADGSQFPVELAITRIPTDGPPSFTGYLRDITERNRALETLQANQDLLDLAQKSAGAMAFDWHIQGDINHWSPEQEALFGLAPGSFDGTYKSWKKMMYPPDWPIVVDAITHAHQTGQVTAEYRVVWPDGSLHWLSTNGRMFFDDAGAPLRMVGFTSDVTRRKLVEEELRRSEAFLAEAQRLSSIGSFSWRVATGEITWSEQLYRIFEFEPDTTVTFERIRTRVHPDDKTLLDDMIERASAASDFDYEHRLLMPDHSIKYLHLIAHGTQDKDGEVEYIGAVQDVTQRRSSEEALGKARSDLAHVARVMSLGALTASIAHEVNQPLSGIITNASTCVRMLNADPPNVDGARETARRTIRDGHRAADVIAHLRALFSRKEATIETVDLNDATREVIELTRNELQRNRVIVRTELANDLPFVMGDRVQFQQVIMNLVRNASDAMNTVENRPRQLTIRTELHDDKVRFSVEDAGTGFEPESMKRLFEAFYTTKSDGMGIGLSVSRSIIENYHGSLWATPNEGPGSTFSFSLPRETAVASPNEIAAEKKLAAGQN